jgi:hypothetical protein
MNKFDRFIAANKSVETWTERGDRSILTLTEEIQYSKFGKYGQFHVDNADTILYVSKLENISPELLAVTWMSETTFRFYSEPNKNNQPNDFSKWDVGPMQINVGWTTKDIQIKMYSDNSLPILSATGGSNDLFTGDPLINLRLASRKLHALGRAVIIGKEKDNSFTMFPAVTPEQWKVIPEYEKNLRRALLYTGPEARPGRMESYNKFAPMFAKFFEVYTNNV